MLGFKRIVLGQVFAVAALVLANLLTQVGLIEPGGCIIFPGLDVAVLNLLYSPATTISIVWAAVFLVMRHQRMSDLGLTFRLFLGTTLTAGAIANVANCFLYRLRGIPGGGSIDMGYGMYIALSLFLGALLLAWNFLKESSLATR